MQVGVDVECGLFALGYRSPRRVGVLMYLPAVVAVYLSLSEHRGVDGFSHWFDHHFSREHTILVFLRHDCRFPYSLA
jgi:hypothetical protein